MSPERKKALLTQGFHVLLIVALVVLLYALKVVKDSREIYISVLGGVMALPQDFVLQLDGRKVAKHEEVGLLGDQGAIVSVGHGLQSRTDFLAYIEKQQVTKKSQCGVTVETVVDRRDGKSLIIFHNDYDYVVFFSVGEKITARALETLCSSRAT